MQALHPARLGIACTLRVPRLLSFFVCTLRPLRTLCCCCAVMPAVVIRQRKPWRRKDGVFLYFEDNAGVIVNPKGEMKGETRCPLTLQGLQGGQRHSVQFLDIIASGAGVGIVEHSTNLCIWWMSVHALERHMLLQGQPSQDLWRRSALTCGHALPRLPTPSCRLRISSE
jgi:Ribosomal protein L14p/L23e